MSNTYKNTIKLSQIDESLEIACNDQGHYGTPGDSITYKEVSFFLMADGDYRARIDTRWGNNQGYFQQNGGEIERINGATLDAVIEEATAYCGSIEADNEGISRACRLAANEARQWERKHQIVSETPSMQAELYAVKYEGDVLTGTQDTWQIWTAAQLKNAEGDQRILETHKIVNSGQFEEVC